MYGVETATQAAQISILYYSLTQGQYYGNFRRSDKMGIAEHISILTLQNPIMADCLLQVNSTRMQQQRVCTRTISPKYRVLWTFLERCHGTKE